jgi:hypothetical protein
LIVVPSQSFLEKAIQVRCGWRDIGLRPCEDATQDDTVRSAAHRKRIINGNKQSGSLLFLVLGLLRGGRWVTCFSVAPRRLYSGQRSTGYLLGIFIQEAPHCYMTSLPELDCNYSASTLKYTTDLSRLRLRRSDIPWQPLYLLHYFRAGVGAQNARS